MALAVSALATALQTQFAGETTAAGAASAMSSALATFAASGQSNGIPCIPTGTAALNSALGATFATVPGTPAGAAASIAAAMDSFWLLATFVGMLAPPVSVGGSALSSALQSIFASVGGTASAKANSIANAFLAHAMAVVVTFPPGTPFPVV